MKTLRNISVAALLTLATIVMNSQSAQANTNFACASANQQCAIVPGGYAWLDEAEAYCSAHEIAGNWYDVLHYPYECRVEGSSGTWQTGNCLYTDPYGIPYSCQG